MGNYERILLATDFSDHSEVAGRRAMDLARHYKAKLILFHVVEYMIPEIIPIDWMDAIQGEGLDEYLMRQARH